MPWLNSLSAALPAETQKRRNATTLCLSAGLLPLECTSAPDEQLTCTGTVPQLSPNVSGKHNWDPKCTCNLTSVHPCKVWGTVSSMYLSWGYTFRARTLPHKFFSWHGLKGTQCALAQVRSYIDASVHPSIHQPGPTNMQIDTQMLSSSHPPDPTDTRTYQSAHMCSFMH